MGDLDSEKQVKSKRRCDLRAFVTCKWLERQRSVDCESPNLDRILGAL